MNIHRNAWQVAFMVGFLVIFAALLAAGADDAAAVLKKFPSSPDWTDYREKWVQDRVAEDPSIKVLNPEYLIQIRYHGVRLVSRVRAQPGVGGFS